LGTSGRPDAWAARGAAPAQILVPEAGGRCFTLDRRGEGRGIGLVFGSPALMELLIDYLRE
jgi:hypothetical protein